MPGKNTAKSSSVRSLFSPQTAFGMLALLAYAGLIEWVWGWQKIFEQWQSWSFSATLACFAGMLVTYLLRAWRIHDFYRHQARVPYYTSLRVTLLHNLANNLLPMRSGEASFPLLIRAWFGVSATRASGTLLLFRLLDLYSLALVCLTFWLSLEAGITIGLPLCVLLLVLPVLFYPLQHQLKRLTENNTGKLTRLVGKLLEGLPSTRIDLIRCQLISLANWGIKLAIFAWILGSFGEMGTLSTLLGALGGELSSILPLHAPAGVGTYEAGVVAGALIGGAEPGDTLAAAVNLHLLIILGTLLGGLLALALPKPADPVGSSD